MVKQQKECIAYYLIGLHGCGKTTWMHKNLVKTNEHNNKSYSILSMDGELSFLSCTKFINFKHAYYESSKEQILQKHITQFNKIIKHNLNIIFDDCNLSVSERSIFNLPKFYKKYAIVFDIHNINYDEWQRRLQRSHYSFLTEEEQINNINKFEYPSKIENFDNIQIIY